MASMNNPGRLYRAHAIRFQYSRLPLLKNRWAIAVEANNKTTGNLQPGFLDFFTLAKRSRFLFWTLLQ